MAFCGKTNAAYSDADGEALTLNDIMAMMCFFSRSSLVALLQRPIRTRCTRKGETYK